MRDRPPIGFDALLVTAIWFGIVTGLVEGFGLLLFQRINWERWGVIVHVSAPILWISPVVDVLLFSLVAFGLGAAGLVLQRFDALRASIFVLTFAAVYDWLTVTQRLYQAACMLLALGAAVAVVRWFGTHQIPALRIFRRTLPWLAAMLVLAFVGIQGGKWLGERRAEARLPQAAPDAPNVVVVIVDTLRADHVSSYGYHHPITPEIDKLAREGTLFENAVSPSSWSLPSHVSLLTGRYVSEHGVGNVQPSPWLGWNKSSLGGYATLGEALEGKGYRTGAFSANGTYFVGDLGYSRGFIHFDDYFFSLPDMFSRTLWGTEIIRNYCRKIDTDAMQRMVGHGRNFGIRRLASNVNEELFQWIDKDSHHRPFLAVLNYLDAHYPYGGPGSYLKPGWQQDPVGQYDAGIKYLDKHIGELMHGLRRRGMAEKTIVVITSDHGEALGEHGIKYHISTLYWELIHVPLIIRFPGVVPAGTRINRPVTSTAIPATVLGLIDKNGANPFPGPPLNLLWENPETASGWPYPLSEVQQTTIGDDDKATAKVIPTAWDGTMRALITPQWHLITHSSRGDQLYNWVHDPQETDNLINTPQGKTIASALKSQLEAGPHRAGSERAGTN